MVSEEMDDHAMMQETGPRGEVPGVNSGRQAAIVTQNAMASLSEIRQNIERAYIRACRIQAQQIRTGYTIPQQISWTGEDGQHHQKWWSGSDLRGTADFQLKQGSLSMMTPEQKMNMAIQFKQLGVYDQNPDLFYDALTSTLGPVVGLQEDPSRVRIKRQLASWSNGPPPSWLQRKQAEAAAAQASQMAAMAGPPGGVPTANGGGPPPMQELGGGMGGLPDNTTGIPGIPPASGAPAGLSGPVGGGPAIGGPPEAAPQPGGMAGAEPPALGGGPPAPGGPLPPAGPGQPPPLDPALAEHLRHG
jgi:hypothetical protein